jgi:uncharacterized damage-inducible protein DinB
MSHMKRPRSLFLPLAAMVLALGAFAPVVVADPDHAETAGSSSGVKAEMLQWIRDAESKLLDLADATPEAKYSWRPAKDVRSTGEVFMHVATANYGLPSFAGVKPPEGFDFATFEKSKTKKADIVSTLRASFAHMENGLNAMSDADMEKPAEFFGMKTTARGAYMLLLSHCHEHLGQSIAYARSNGIVPPWTARQEAAAAAKKAEKSGMTGTTSK